jgi:RNA polymerase sigma factor (TIGR02999 family)
MNLCLVFLLGKESRHGALTGAFKAKTQGNHGSKCSAVMGNGLQPQSVNRQYGASTDPMRTDVSESQECQEGGQPPPAPDLLPLVYEELRKIAAHKMAQEAPGQTLQPTALVHEAWLRLGADAQPAWKNRAHFFAAAAEAMRRILVERARRRTALKRRVGAGRVSLDEAEIPLAAADDESLLAVDEVLEQFAAIHPRQAELVKLRFFAGMTFEEAATVLGIAVPKAKKWWAYARAWLAVQMLQSK